MAPTPEEWELAHSLWLQRRATRRAVRRAHWRSDWTPLGFVLLLLGLLIVLSLFLPSHEAVDRAKQAAHDGENGSQGLPVVGVLTEP